MFLCFLRDYFPIRNWLKIKLSKSSAVSEFAVASSLWLEIGAQRRHYNS